MIPDAELLVFKIRHAFTYKKGLDLLLSIKPSSALAISFDPSESIPIQWKTSDSNFQKMSPTNYAAWLNEANTPHEVREAPMPTAGPDELVIRNFAVAINPLDTHMQKSGVFVQQWPSILGCDVAGEVHQVGRDAQARFKKGDRVIG